ncbi:MAG TPA: DUF6603 domain-containing protein [Vicinamibacterales bacterium]|jgi:hypothetical protein|nr:DUF6603 domain-containing protein [Vicinamibacterales bacterium]
MADALQSVLTELGLAIAPFRAVKTPDQAVAFFRQLGYELPAGAFGSGVNAVATQASGLIAALEGLVNAKSDSEIAGALADIFAKLVAAVHAIEQLHSELEANAGGTPNLADLPRRLTDFLLLDYLERARPQAHAGLHLLGLIDRTPSPPAGQTSRTVNWERLTQFINSPGQIAEDVYHWSSGFDATTFLARLAELMKAGGLPGGVYPQPDSTKAVLGNTSSGLTELRFPVLQKGFTPDTYSQFGITFSPADAQGGGGKGFALLPYIMGAVDFQFDVCDRGQLTFQSSADIKGVGVVVRPPFNAQAILNAAGDFGASITIAEKPDKAEEIILVGSAGGSRLAVQGLGVSWFAKTTSGKLDLGVEGEIQAIRLVIGGGDGDGFIQQILSGLNIQAEAQLGLGMSLLSGFIITGGGKLTIELRVHIDLGPVAIQALQLTLQPAADKFHLGAGVNLTAKLGPLAAAVEGIGLQAALQFKHGNLGPAQLDISFQPPKGVGLSVDAGVVQGGGYLYIDTDRGEYAGALQLEIADFLSVAAIGLISTKMPDGSSGFSLLIILSADFGPGIQLSFGFTLLAVGGLLGLNRTVLFQPLLDGIRTNAVQSIMFPQDIIANAPRIISDLRAIFPPQQGTFLIGPMAKIGWGEPTLISLSLGVIIEIPPGDAAILGILRAALPADDIAILVLQVNFAGVLEFDKKRFYFYASLFDSHILFITISGSMGVLFGYGADANFVLSVGGFHPQFNPPPLPFPAPQRISIDLINESFARIHADGYFAVTTNTVQFGTHSDFFFGFSACSVSGSSGFDALIQFSPFHFIAEISTQFSVQVFGIGVYGVGIDVLLSGPGPWHVHGTASLSFFFFSIDIGIDFTWGDDPNTTLPPVQVMPILAAEAQKASNWKTALPPNVKLLVVLRQLDPTETALVLHPAGTLQVSQRAIPLDLKIDKVGSQAPSDANQFAFSAGGTVLTKSRDLQEPFAPSQFRNFDDATKLSQPAFVPQDSGIELAGAATLATSTAITRPLRYDLTVVDKESEPVQFKFFAHSRAMFTNFLAGNSAGRSRLSANFRSLSRPQPGSVAVSNETFAVALQSSNQVVHPEAAAFFSQAQAQDYISSAIAANPSLEGTLHVIPQFEVAA